MTSVAAALVVLAAPLLLWWLRRARHSSAPPLRVTARTALTKSSVVAVIEAGGRRFLVGAGEAGVAVLAEIEGGDEDGHLEELPAEPAFRPGMGQLDRLRALTVRRPPHPRPARVQRS